MPIERPSLNIAVILQSLIVVSVSALAGVTWNLSAAVSLLSYKVDTALSDRYTGKEARKDIEIQKGVDVTQNQRMDIHQGILNRQQATIDQYDSTMRH